MSFEKAGETGQTAENKGNPLETFTEMRKKAKNDEEKKVTDHIKESARKKTMKESSEDPDVQESQEPDEVAASRTKAQLEAKESIKEEIARIFEFKTSDGNDDLQKVKDEIEKSQKFLSGLERNFTTDDPEMQIDIESLREYKKLSQEIDKLQDQKSKLESEDKIREARKNIQRSGASVEDPDNKSRNRLDIFTHEGEAFMAGGRDGKEDNDPKKENPIDIDNDDKDKTKVEKEEESEPDDEGRKNEINNDKGSNGPEKRKRSESASAEAYRKLTEKIEALYGCMNTLDEDKDLEDGQKAFLDKLSVKHEYGAIKDKIIALEEDRTILAGSMRMTGAGQDYRSMMKDGASAYEYYGNASETLAAAKTLEIAFTKRLERELPLSRRGAVFQRESIDRFSDEVSEEIGLRDRVVRGRDVSDIESKNTSDWWLMDKLLKLTGKEKFGSEIKDADNRGKCKHKKEDLGNGRYRFIIEWEDTKGQKKELDIRVDIKDSTGTGTLRGLVWDRSKDRIIGVGVKESEIEDEELEDDSPQDQEEPKKEIGGFKEGEYGFTGWEAGIFWKLARGQKEDETRALRILLDKMDQKDQYYEEIRDSKDAKYSVSVHGKKIFFDVRWKDADGNEKNLMFMMTGEEPGGLRKRMGLVHEYPYQIEVASFNTDTTEGKEKDKESDEESTEGETASVVNEKLRKDYPKTVDFLDFTLRNSPNSDEAVLGVQGVQELLGKGKGAEAAEQIRRSIKELEEASGDGSELDESIKDKIADFIRFANEAVKELEQKSKPDDDIESSSEKGEKERPGFEKTDEVKAGDLKPGDKVLVINTEGNETEFEKLKDSGMFRSRMIRGAEAATSFDVSLESDHIFKKNGNIAEVWISKKVDASGKGDEDSEEPVKETRESLDKLYGEKLEKGERAILHSGDKEYALYFDNDTLILEDTKGARKYILDKDFQINKGAEGSLPLAGTYNKPSDKGKLKDNEGRTNAGTRQSFPAGVIDKIEIIRNAS